MISSSVKDYIKLVQPYTSSDLISPETWSKINAVAEFLPSAITNFFGFECPLGIAAAKSDFLICTDVAEKGREVLAADDGGLSKYLLSHAIWHQVNEFSQVWQNENSVLNQQIHNVWLEFDIDDYDNSLPVPSCFFGSQPIFSAKSPYANLTGNDAYQWISQTALKLLLNTDLPESVAANLFKCLDLLPQEAYVFQIGLMLARNIHDQVRICIRNISPAQIGEYLQQIGWSGSRELLQEFLQEIACLVERIDLDIDIGEKIGAKIGLECYISRQPKLEPRWPLFLDYLVQHNLCLPQKQAALLAYPGFLRESAAQNNWPIHLSQSANLRQDQAEAVFFRKLHHIKIVYQDDRPQLAKAYLSMFYNWITPDFVQRWRQVKNYIVKIDSFLNQAEQSKLLQFVQDSQPNFVTRELVINHPEVSIHERNLLLQEFPEFEKIIQQKLTEILPDVLAKLGLLDAPIEHLEMYLSAYNDGDYYKYNYDNRLKENSDRILSYVYYFHQEPQAFNGGELRIYESNATDKSYFTDSCQTIEPINNSIVFFPGAYMHEILKVHCPAPAFVNSCFMIHGWVWQKK